MNCEVIEYNYLHSILPNFIEKCTKAAYRKDYWPIKLEFNIDDTTTGKILFDISYAPNNTLFESRLPGIKSTLEDIAYDFDMKLSETTNSAIIMPVHKLGGREFEHNMLKNFPDGKKCVRYTFTINPDFQSETYLN